mmetsp:Transcript_35046/g.84851  ORF Transcript_35046/g.84851 Transcript_35046/m.84851 type:complete len:234 (+) Transcript_35046:1651-2352(+)
MWNDTSNTSIVSTSGNHDTSHLGSMICSSRIPPFLSLCLTKILSIYITISPGIRNVGIPEVDARIHHTSINSTLLIPVRIWINGPMSLCQFNAITPKFKQLAVCLFYLFLKSRHIHNGSGGASTRHWNQNIFFNVAKLFGVLFHFFQFGTSNFHGHGFRLFEFIADLGLWFASCCSWLHSLSTDVVFFLLTVVESYQYSHILFFLCFLLLCCYCCLGLLYTSFGSLDQVNEKA